MVIRSFPQAGDRKKARRRKRKVFIVYEHRLFKELVTNLLETSDEVEVVGVCNNLYEAAHLIEETRAETVLVEGDPASSRSMSLLNYLIIATRGGQWIELVVLGVDSNEFATVYRGNISQLDTKRLLSLILAG